MQTRPDPPEHLPTIEDCAKRLREATETHAIAASHAEAARRTETEARNALNAAQKDFDRTAQAMRTSAPRDSDWRRSPGHPAPSKCPCPCRTCALPRSIGRQPQPLP